MKHKHLDFARALKLLHELIDQTHAAIEKAKTRGDQTAAVSLILAQRRNLKLLLHKLEKAKETKNK